LAVDIPSVEQLLARSAENRSGTVQDEHRSALALELIADTLVALLAELQKPVERTVTSLR
jgi:hypothetical protein